MLVVLVDVDDTLPSIFSSDMALAITLHKGGIIGINAGELEALTPELEAVKSNTGVIPFSKSLKQRLSVALKTVLEVGVQRFTSI